MENRCQCCGESTDGQKYCSIECRKIMTTVEKRYCKLCDRKHKRNSDFCSARCQMKYNRDNLKYYFSSRFKIFERDNFTCIYCGASSLDGTGLHLDHIYPLSKGGDNDPNNLVTSCKRCNLEKSSNIMTKKNLITITKEVMKRNNNISYNELKVECDKYFRHRNS